MKKYRVENPPISYSLKKKEMNITKNARSYKKNADEVNRKNAKENLRQAEEYERNGNIKERNSCLKSAALNFIDADEKYIKAYVELNKTAKKIHTFRDLYNQYSINDIITEEEIEFLDGYSNDKNKSSHTELEYGDCQPTMDEVRRLESITEKLHKIVDEKMDDAKYNRKYLAITEDNSVAPLSA